jgi:hypothetical protein
MLCQMPLKLHVRKFALNFTEGLCGVFFGHETAVHEPDNIIKRAVAFTHVRNKCVPFSTYVWQRKIAPIPGTAFAINVARKTMTVVKFTHQSFERKKHLLWLLAYRNNHADARHMLCHTLARTNQW